MPQHFPRHTGNRPKSPKNLSPARSQAQQQTRIRNAINTARNLLQAFKKGDAQAITEATILQGILSGDVTAASVAVKLKLQRENLRLRQLLTRSRLISEELKQRITRKQGDLITRTKLTAAQSVDAIRAVYGLNPENPQILNVGAEGSPRAENPQENPSTLPQVEDFASREDTPEEKP